MTLQCFDSDKAYQHQLLQCRMGGRGLQDPHPVATKISCESKMHLSFLHNKISTMQVLKVLTTYETGPLTDEIQAVLGECNILNKDYASDASPLETHRNPSLACVSG